MDPATMDTKTEKTTGASPTTPAGLSSQEVSIWLEHVDRWDASQGAAAIESADRLILALRARKAPRQGLLDEMAAQELP